MTWCPRSTASTRSRGWASLPPSTSTSAPTSTPASCCAAIKSAGLRNRDHDSVDIVEQTRVASRYRGFQSGVSYAEGFTESFFTGCEPDHPSSTWNSTRAYIHRNR